MTEYIGYAVSAYKTLKAIAEFLEIHEKIHMKRVIYAGDRIMFQSYRTKFNLVMTILLYSINTIIHFLRMKNEKKEMLSMILTGLKKLKFDLAILVILPVTCIRISSKIKRYFKRIC